MVKTPVYLDHHSTCPLDERVAEKMRPFWSEHFGNPSSFHAMGEYAQEAVERARSQVAALINAEPEQIYFTSGATEANNIAITGRLLRSYPQQNMVTTLLEHSSVIDTANAGVVHHGLGVSYVITDAQGQIVTEDFEKCLQRHSGYSQIDMVSIMMANNEIGVINNIEMLAGMCVNDDVFFHTDATQAIGRVPVDVKKLGVDALSMSAHKIYGPKGVGAVFLKTQTDVSALIHGGYQDIVTSGTRNVPAIVGFGAACELLDDNEYEIRQVEQLRDRLQSGILSTIPDVTVNGPEKNRLCNNLNISIEGVPSEVLIVEMDDIIISAGAACKSTSHKPSEVLLSIGAEHPECAVRFGLGRSTTLEEIDYTVDRLKSVVANIRGV